MSAKERIALQQEINRTKALEIQRQKELAEIERRNQLSTQQRHEEDMAKIQKEKEQARAVGNGGFVVLCIMFGC